MVCGAVCAVVRETTREVCAVLIHSYSRFGAPITVTGVRGVCCGVCCGVRPVVSYIRVVGPWKNFSLALLAICFTTTFAIHMQKFTVSTDSNHNCFSKERFWKRNIGWLMRGGRDLW